MMSFAKRLALAFVVGGIAVGFARACRSSLPTETTILWSLVYVNAAIVLGGFLLVAGVGAWWLARIERNVHDWRHADNAEEGEENDGGL